MNDQDKGDQKTEGDRVDQRDAILRLLDRPLTDDEVREATKRVATPLEPPDRDVVSLLLMRIGSEHLALSSVDVARVTRMVTIRRIPHRTNAVIRGMCNVDGEILLCGDLRTLLGLGDEDATSSDRADANLQRQRLVVFGEESERWAVEVDEVSGVVYLEAAALLPPPETVQQAADRYTRNLAPLEDGNFAAVLDDRRVASGFKAALS